MTAETSGAHGRAIFVDAIDEALRRRANLVTKPKPPRRPRRQLNDIAMRQLKRAERIQRLMTREIVEIESEKDAEGKPSGKVPGELVTNFNQLTHTVSNLMEQIRRGEKAEREKFGGLTEDQMDEVFKQQLHRIAPSIQDYDRYVLLTAWYGEEIATLLTGKAAQ
jgi:hypothetical protein